MDVKESLPQEKTSEFVEPQGMNPKGKPSTFGFFVIAFLLFLVSLFVLSSNLNSGFTKKTDVAAPQPAVTTPLFLSLAGVKGALTAVNGEILVSGKTLPFTTVMIYSDIDDASLESDVNGVFEDTVKVGEEGGLIRVIAYAENGEEKSETLMIQIEEDVLGKSDKVTVQDKKVQNSTETTVNASVKAKVTPTAKQIQATLETEKKINQQKINKFLQTTTFPKSTKIGTQKLKEILSQESTEGAKLKNNLKLQKMLVTEATPAATLKRHAVSGVIVAVSGEEITIAHQIQREKTYKIYVNEGTVITSKDGAVELDVGMRIAVVGEPVEEDLLAKRVHVIPGKATGVFSKQPVFTESGTPTATDSPPLTITPTKNLTSTPSPEVISTPIPTATDTLVPEPTTTPIL